MVHWRRAASILLLLLLVAAPVASAHDEARPATYNPLDLEIHTWLTKDGQLSSTTPDAAASLPFAAIGPGGTPTPLAWSLVGPVRFSATTGLAVTLALRAEKPVVWEGDGLRFTLLADGEPVEGATRDAALPREFTTPGATGSVDVILQAPSTVFEKGQRLELQVVPLMPLLAEGALHVLLGPEASRADFQVVRVPRAQDLELNEATLPTWALADGTYRPSDPEATVYEARVTHDSVTLPTITQPVDVTVVIVFRGEETAEDAYAAHHHADAQARRDAAHEFFVGDTRVRVHPGLGVAVSLTSSVEKEVRIRCGANCPQQGFTSAVRFVAPQDVLPAPGTGSSIIPPPRDTSGIPVSKDAPAEPERAVPAPGAALVVLVAALAARRRHAEMQRGRRDAES